MQRLAGVRLQQLLYLDALARNGRYQDAADELQVSQSALSQGIARLESAVGLALVEPDGRTHRLTNTGAATLEWAQGVIGLTRSFDDQLDDRREGRRGRLRVGMVDAAALYLLREPLEAFRNANPDIRLDLSVDVSSRLLEALERGELDMAIVVGPAANPAAVEVVREPLYVYGPPITSLDDIDRWVLYPSESRTRRFVNAGLAAAGLRVDQVSESANPAVLAQLVRLGEGWAVLPAGIAELGEALDRQSDAIAERPLFATRRTGAADDPVAMQLTAALLRG